VGAAAAPLLNGLNGGEGLAEEGAAETQALRVDPVADSLRQVPLHGKAGLRKLLSTPPPPGANLVIASHGNPFYAVAGAPYLAEGEAAVVRPLGSDFEIVARVRHDSWRELEKTNEWNRR